MTRQEHEKLVLSEIDNLFEYRDGEIYWKKRPANHFCTSRSLNTFNGTIASNRAGSKSAKYYTVVTILMKDTRFVYFAHRLVWALHYKSWPKDQIDHIDHDRNNNSILNLREVSRAENQKNRSRPKNNTSGHMGVTLHKPSGKWRAIVVVDGKQKSLGYYHHIEDAVDARSKANSQYCFHANHGLEKPKPKNKKPLT